MLDVKENSAHFAENTLRRELEQLRSVRQELYGVRSAAMSRAEFTSCQITEVGFKISSIENMLQRSGMAP